MIKNLTKHHSNNPAIQEENILDYPDYYVQSERHHPMHRVAEIAKSRGWHKKRIGVEMEAYYFTAGAMAALRKKLPRTQFKDARHLVNWVRMIQSVVFRKLVLVR